MSKKKKKGESTDLFRCTYEAKSERYGFAICLDMEQSDFYIPAEYANTAMNKDEVLVKCIKNATEKDRKVGKIVNIVKRNTKTVIGKYTKNRNFGFVQPINANMQDIYVSKKGNKNIKDGVMVEVLITKYPTGRSKAEGQIISVLGNADDILIESKALFMEYGLDEKEKFNKGVMEEVEKIPSIVSEQDKKNRVDKTKERIFTIDSEDAMDLDDAVCIKQLQNKNYMLSVHIADVSHYVKDGTKLNAEAVYRGTSIYIPNYVIPMLPTKLSNGICSLNAGVERLALSIDMEIDENGKVVNSEIYKSVIKVTKKMTYEKVYNVICNENPKVLEEYKEYKKDITLMKTLAEILNKKRVKEGSINFDIPETKIVTDENGNVVNVKPYEINTANKIIEEFMLISNVTIAEKFYFLESPFIYRIHENPDEDKLNDLNKLLSLYGRKLKSTKNVHPKMLQNIINSFEDETSKDVISRLMLRTLKLARYSEECVGHFGLAFKYYCHFTSPIRRYPDLFIHRVISDIIKNGYKLDQKIKDKYSKQAREYAKTSSDMEKEATKIERDFDDLYMCIYMKERQGEEFEATISSVTSFGMFVRLDNTVEGLVGFRSMGNDYYVFDEKKYRIVGTHNGKVYKIGDRIKVRLTRADVRMRQIDFEII
ncbi:MAG: ribonuclease R [Oscillospiraceae bacterium]|nr:ribonuclease R [Oscillospiraceae bacterium]